MIRYTRLFLFVILLVACSPATVAVPTEVPATTTPETNPSPPETATPQPTIAPSPTAVAQPFALLFASDREGAGALYLRHESGTIERLTDPATLPAWQPALHHDGTRLLFMGRRGGQSDIALMASDGSGLTWLTDHLADDYSPAWSRDGGQVAWVSERGGLPQIWIMEPGREAEARRLPGSYGEQRTRDPAWAGDGTLLFAAMDEEGIWTIQRYNPATGEVTALTQWPFKAVRPAVSVTGEIVVVGWGEDLPRRGLYRLHEDGPPELLWETTDWIGDPAWSADGKWILFTRWTSDGLGHDLWALPAEGGEPVRVSAAPSWEADAAPWPTSLGTVPPTPDVQAFVPPAPEEMILGFNVANVDNARISRDLGFGWAKGFAFWERIEPEPQQYEWIDVDNTVQRYEEAGLKVFLRVDRTPTWARPPGTTGSHPPEDLTAFANFLEILARRYRGRVHAYELWNEPNLSFEWGEKRPDPAYYVEMLRVAAPALRRGDPDARLVVGALAVTETGERSMNEMEWMEGFYRALGDVTPRPYDAFSTHPYGFGQSPDRPPEEGPGLRRLEEQRALMEAWGDHSPMWLTELGYTRVTPGWDLGEHAPWGVSDELQARYLVETLDFIEREYDFVEAAFLFNLDFSTADWYRADEQMRSFAILDSARRPLPAFSALHRRWIERVRP